MKNRKHLGRAASNSGGSARRFRPAITLCARTAHRGHAAWAPKHHRAPRHAPSRWCQLSGNATPTLDALTTPKGRFQIALGIRWATARRVFACRKPNRRPHIAGANFLARAILFLTPLQITRLRGVIHRLSPRARKTFRSVTAGLKKTCNFSHFCGHSSTLLIGYTFPQ